MKPALAPNEQDDCQLHVGVTSRASIAIDIRIDARSS
jgi:hypothetical protein